MIDLQIPVLKTERLTLRGPEARDFDAIAAFYANPEHSWGFGGVLDRNNAWRWFASMIGHWVLRGYGFWTVETKDGDVVGIVGIWNPEGWPEPEIGWVMFEGFEGKGYAFEAATEVRRFAYQVLGFETLTSNIVPGNDKSVALAKKLGAWFEVEYDNVNMGTDHLYRHPSAATLEAEA